MEEEKHLNAENFIEELSSLSENENKETELD